MFPISDIDVKEIDKSRVIKSISKSQFDIDVINRIVDVASVNVYSVDENGYRIKITQTTIEASDIVEYFREKFKSRYSDPKSGKFTFLSYNKNDRQSNIIFGYKWGMFEKK